MNRLLLFVLLVLLTACEKPDVAVPPVQAPAAQTPATAPAAVQDAVVAHQPLPQAVEDAPPIVQSPVQAMIEAVEPMVVGAVLPPATGPPPEMAECRRAAADLIIRWEVTGPSRYNRALRFPIWPGGASGVTWGVGYDGGHQTSRVILDDWGEHAGKSRLALTAGLTGKRAKAALPKYRDIETLYPYAAHVFETRSLIEYERVAERAFRVDLATVPTGVCAALVSIAYNRGGATAGDSRREIRNIRDDRIPKQDWSGVAYEIRSMKRLWRGTVNEKGLSARREDEAVLVETLT